MPVPILISFELPNPKHLSSELIESIAPLPVVLAGHYAVPEQTPARDARRQFGEDAKAELEAVADRFEQAGSPADIRLQFGKDHDAAVDTIAREEDCSAELIAASTDELKRILVPIPDVAEFDRLPDFLHRLSGDSTDQITLFHAVEGGEDAARGEEILQEEQEDLVDAGFNLERIETRLSQGSHDDEILDVADGYDGVVMYSPSSRIGDRIFGSLANRISERNDIPVVVIRRDY